MFKLTLLVCLTLAIFVNCEEKNAKQYFAPTTTTSTSSGLSGSGTSGSSGSSGGSGSGTTVGLLSGPGGQPGTLSGGGGSPAPAPQTTLAPAVTTQSTTQASSSSILPSSSSEITPVCDVVGSDCLDDTATSIADLAACTPTSVGCNSVNIDPKPVCTCGVV